MLERLSHLPLTDEMTRRDAFDIAKTILGRFANASLLHAQLLYATSAPEGELDNAMAAALGVMDCLAETLGAHEDYSLSKTLEGLRSVTDTNPDFERTLKNNAECMYCRGYIYENSRYLYLPEAEILFDEVKRAACDQRELDRAAVTERIAQNKKYYFETPLCQMQAEPLSFDTVAKNAAEAIKKLGF